MADFNIDGNLNFTPHSAFSTNTTAITFHAAKACTLTFSPAANCFGITTQVLPAGGQPTTIPVTAQISTNFTCAANNAAAASRSPSGDETYDITFGSR